jgi:hypothetical protein
LYLHACSCCLDGHQRGDLDHSSSSIPAVPWCCMQLANP